MYSKVPHNCNTPKKPIEPLKPLNFGGKLRKSTNQNSQDCQSGEKVIRTSSAFSAREETESSTATSNERKMKKHTSGAQRLKALKLHRQDPKSNYAPPYAISRWKKQEADLLLIWGGKTDIGEMQRVRYFCTGK